MAKIKYSEKEIAILNGMINLIKNGANPYLVKVSDIAKSAGVGKGTIYDYFQTKEEVVAKAMLFNLRNETDLLAKRINAKIKFKEKYYEVLRIIVENLQNKFSTFNIFVSAGRLSDLKMEHLELHEDCIDHISRVQEIMDDLLVSGYNEGEIKEIETIHYRRMVIQSSLFSLGNFLIVGKDNKEIELQEAMDYAYKIMIKSLN